MVFTSGRASIGMTILTVAWRRAGMLMALVLLIIAASFLSDRFLTVPNLLNVLRQVAIVGILALGFSAFP